MVEETDYGGCWHKVSFSYGRYLRKHENKIFISCILHENKIFNYYNITRKQDFIRKFENYCACGTFI